MQKLVRSDLRLTARSRGFAASSRPDQTWPLTGKSGWVGTLDPSGTQLVKAVNTTWDEIWWDNDSHVFVYPAEKLEVKYRLDDGSQVFAVTTTTGQYDDYGNPGTIEL